MILKLAWKNLWRNPQRTAINMAAILFAVFLSVLTSSLKKGIFDNLILNLVGFYSGYIQIHKTGYWDEQILENSFQSSLKIEGQIRNDKRISFFTPRFESFALASAGELTKGCLVNGVEPDSEDAVIALRSRVTQGQFFRYDDRSVMIAEGLMKRLKLKLGDTLILIGQGYHGATAAGKYPIAATVRFGSPELNNLLVFLPLKESQELFASPGRITSYVLALHKLRDLDQVDQVLQAGIGTEHEVMTWEEMMPDVKQHIHIDSNNMQVVQGILYLLICFGLFSTMLMMMSERKFEMGMLVAIGMKKGRLIRMFMAESVVTLFGGCMAGLATALPLVYYLNRHPVRITGQMAKAYEQFGFEPIFPTSVSAVHFAEQGMIVLIIGLALSIYPVVQIWNLDPVKAMRK